MEESLISKILSLKTIEVIENMFIKKVLIKIG
jgi:hypothetical protein